MISTHTLGIDVSLQLLRFGPDTLCDQVVKQTGSKLEILSLGRKIFHKSGLKCFNRISTCNTRTVQDEPRQLNEGETYVQYVLRNEQEMAENKRIDTCLSRKTLWCGGMTVCAYAPKQRLYLAVHAVTADNFN